MGNIGINIIDKYNNCLLCPKSCGVNRTAGEKGYCGEGADLRLAFAGLHRGEEPPLSGEKGSGTVFVSGCNLRCVICQNWQISSGGGDACECLGRSVSTEEFAEICLALQNKGAENINIVTGSHAVPAIVTGLAAAKASGLPNGRLQIPVLWNSSGYETPETLELLNGLVDTWLPDLKTLDGTLSKRLHAPDYPEAATAAIRWMIKNKPQNVIIRHLILPGHLESTRAVLRWFAENTAGKALLSLMSQYTPITGADQQGGLTRQDGFDRHGPPRRFLTKKEYETVLGWLEEFGIEDGFCQDYVTGNDWLPDFTLSNPFSSELSVPVWHFRNGE